MKLKASKNSKAAIIFYYVCIGTGVRAASYEAHAEPTKESFTAAIQLDLFTVRG